MLATINRTATRKKVEQVLSIARMYKRAGSVRKEMRTTSVMEPRWHGPTNTISKPVEQTAVNNIEREAYMKQMYQNVTTAVAHLGEMERQVVERSYLDPKSDVPDYMLSIEMNLSERTFRRIKARAVMELAFILGLEVFEE
ncbi:ArpU family phage packaging/lysis transcriptional regulator [Paenibacillus sp. 481]|uniref:ArpU family phage packaging/lysis transcriptional regulator n=1 Tax=Paenibacillus sp. 481 TaxID=2835869 RepID=UPI001E5B8035|nr:ArpU family phage packaging/lysis transcriptional regulator [Paenibacillus sp. 481]UHA72291.1 ArpU family transcriptional regulator [Paenibacillus sp. 481]